MHGFGNIKCAKCGEDIDRNDGRTLYGPRVSLDGERFHFECADFETRLHPESVARFHAWHLQKLRSENTVLRHKVDTLMRELIRLMTAQGAGEQEIADVQEEFRLYDENPRE